MPDTRFSENKDTAAVSPANVNLQEAVFISGQGSGVNCFILILIHYQKFSVFITADTLGTSDQSEHLKNDGTPDMRYKDNQEAAASAEVQTSAGGGEFFSHIFLAVL
jgi:hypothetical protein